MTALVNSSLVVNQLLYDYVNSVNMFFIIKCGRFNDLEESVMCGIDSLASLRLEGMQAKNSAGVLR